MEVAIEISLVQVCVCVFYSGMSQVPHVVEIRDGDMTGIDEMVDDIADVPFEWLEVHECLCELYLKYLDPEFKWVSGVVSQSQLDEALALCETYPPEADALGSAIGSMRTALDSAASMKELDMEVIHFLGTVLTTMLSIQEKMTYPAVEPEAIETETPREIAGDGDE